MTNFAPTRNTYGTSDRRWARNFLALDTHGVTLNGSLFTPDTVVPSGTHIGRVTATGLCGPYSNDANDGRETSVGILINDYTVSTGQSLVAVANGGGPVDRRYLPSGHDAAAEADLPAISWIN